MFTSSLYRTLKMLHNLFENIFHVSHKNFGVLTDKDLSK